MFQDGQNHHDKTKVFRRRKGGKKRYEVAPKACDVASFPGHSLLSWDPGDNGTAETWFKKSHGSNCI